MPLVLGVDDVVGQRLHVAADGGQRRAQLVRDAHQEQPLVLLRLPQPVDHVAERPVHDADLVRPRAVELDVVAPAADRAGRDHQPAQRPRDVPAQVEREQHRDDDGDGEGRGDAPEEVGAGARQVLDRRRQRERADGAEVLRAARLVGREDAASPPRR